MHTFQEKADILVHTGDDYDRYLGAIVPPIFQNSLFRVIDDNGQPLAGYGYTRSANPTIEVSEHKIAGIECAPAAVCSSSGMAAITSSILHAVKAGDHVVCVRSCYGGTRAFLDNYLPKFGVGTTYVHGEDLSEIEQALQENTRLIYLESPSTGVFRLQDLEAVARLAKARGIVTAIDNTWSTPIWQNPYTMGIDLCVHSASKYMGGHSDIVAGAVAGSEQRIESIRGNERGLLGACMDPQKAFLLTRGLRTLHLRMRHANEAGLMIARYLEKHEKVSAVLHPGLESHPSHALAERQMMGYGSLFSIVLDMPFERRTKFIRKLRMFQNGCSWGGHESLIIELAGEQTAEQLANVDFVPGLIRMYVGLEEESSLIEDLDQALKVL